MIPLRGETDPAFAGVRDTLHSSIEQGTDLGAGVAVWVDGAPVMDLTAGWKNRQQTEDFGDTLVCVYSSGKAILAAIVMRAVAQGHLDYDAPVADLWPAFGAEGKEEITLAQVMSHQGGLAAFMDPIAPADWLNWDLTCERLAAMEPIWPPGTQSGYHPQTVGFVAGEILRRATGNSIGEHLRTLGLDVYCGLDAATRARTGPMVKPPAAPDLGPLTPLKRAAFLSPWSSPAGVDREAWMAAEIPAANMHANASGLAAIMNAFATGKVGDEPFTDPSTREAALAERIRGDDLVLPFDLSWAAGPMRNLGGELGPSPTAIGHYGFGGSCVLADPAHGLAFAYVPNKMSPALVRDPRALALIEAVYGAL